VATAVDARLESVLAAEVSRWASFDPGLEPPFDALRSFVFSDQDRLRPALCHWGFVGVGGDRTSTTWVDAGAALELLHCFAIVHEDIRDRTRSVQGPPTLDLAFASRHQAAGWRGESRRFGEGAAVIVGNLAFVLADRLLAATAGPARDVWDELRLEANAGQYLHLLHTARGEPSVASTRRIWTHTTATYAVERPLRLGAALAGVASQATEAALTAYGMRLGEALQLIDDIHGAFGDPLRPGMPVGADIRGGQPTRLVALGLERAGGADLTLLRTRVGEADLADEEVLAILDVLEATGARAEVEAAITDLTGSASCAAAELPVTDEARTALSEIAASVAHRDR